MTPESTNNRKVHAALAALALILTLSATAAAASEKVLYRFHGADGRGPSSVIIGPDGALYGTTMTGGTNCLSTGNGCGVVFRLAQGADGKWHETVLHDFAGSDGWFPNGALVADRAGNLYGTTVNGGPSCSQLGCGVVFELVRKATAGRWTFKVLHNFAITDGANPYAGMIFDSHGNLYGTTSSGGNMSACYNEGGCGLVFNLTPSREGKWTETVVYAFDGTDGGGPWAPVTFDSFGSLYGTTLYGGANKSGTVFKLTSGKNGQWGEEVLHSFSSDTRDGYEPTYGVILDKLGNLYGTTTFGGMAGQQGWGTAFKLTPEAGGKWKEAILRRFDRAKFGGGDPTSGLVLDGHGDLYGTAEWGGSYDCPTGGGLGCGVLFRLSLQTGGGWRETVVHSFGGGNDGSFPGGSLILLRTGHLFGLTASGGYVGDPCGKDGCGVVYDFMP